MRLLDSVRPCIFVGRGMDRKILVGQRIRKLRKLRKLSQGVLADRASTSAKYLSRIEIGHENPTIDLLFRLADSLNVEPYEMLYFENGELVRQLRIRAEKLIDEVPDEDIARVVGLLEAVLH